MPLRNNAFIVSTDVDDFISGDDEEIPARPIQRKKLTSFRGMFFPWMSRKLYRSYSNHCRKNVNFFAIIPIFALITVIVVARLNLEFPHSNIWFCVSDLFLILAFILFTMNISPIVLGRVLKNQIAADKMKNFITRLPFHLEDILMFFSIGIYGFNLVGRIVSGACPEDVTPWQTQTCSPDDDSVPSEIVTILYIMPILCIIAIENVSVASLIFSWLIIIGFVAFSIIYYNALSQIWMLFNSLFFVTMTYIVERDKRIAFLRLIELKEQKKMALTHLRNQHGAETALAEQRRMAEVASVTATNERKLRVTETQQLRNLMGNVAHDLKTPLFSVEADIELLKLLFNAIPPQAIQMALTSLSENFRGQNIDYDPAMIFDSLWSTCRFMIAAINRCQDFAKTSMNVILIPNQGDLFINTHAPIIMTSPDLPINTCLYADALTGTIEVNKTMTTAIRCVRHLLSTELQLIIHPMPSNLCDFIITDGHWLLENLLCLLSNAIKYSSSGEISLTIELVEKGSEPSDAAVVRLDDDGIPMSTNAQSLDPSHRSTRNNTTMVLVIVEDEGVGVSSEVRLTLFQPFKQAQRLAGGTGWYSCMWTLLYVSSPNIPTPPPPLFSRTLYLQVWGFLVCANVWRH